MKSAVCLLGALLPALVSTAGVEWYAVDPMSETQYLPDVVPDADFMGVKSTTDICNRIADAMARFDSGDNVYRRATRAGGRLP